MDTPTLMFGIGATKSGTSWLYRYFAAHPECYVREIKELHFFDTIDGGNVQRMVRRIDRRYNRLSRLQARPDARNPVGRAIRMAALKEQARVIGKGTEAAYLDYLNSGRTTERLIADITPAYALLSEGRLKRMAGMAPEVRFVYLMRDPVDRLWSHVRMIAKRRSRTGRDIEARAGKILERALRGGEEHILMRGDYSANLSWLTSAVPEQQIHLETYESLFSDEAMRRLCDFLGIGYHPGDFASRVHEGVSLGMSAEQRARAAEALAPQYDFVEATLGRIPDAWHANRAGA